MNKPILRHADSAGDIARCYALMRELRPHLQSEAEFVERVQRQQSAGYFLLTAALDGRIVGLAGYRAQENLIYGHFIYVDDLVVDPDVRRGGIGAHLLDGVVEECRRQAVPTLVLDTAIGNSLGQRFYFRYGMLARGLRFSMPVTP